MRIRKSIIIVLLSFMLLISTKKIYSNEGAVTIKLPKGISIRIPRDWVIASGSDRIILKNHVDSFIDFQNKDASKFTIDFFAAYLDSNEAVVAKAIVNYYPETKFTQSDVQAFNEHQVAVWDEGKKKNIEKGIKSVGGEIKSWLGTRKIVIKGITMLITEYTYFNNLSNQINTVRIVSVLNGNNSFSLIVSYRDNESKIMRPVCDNIIDSLKVTVL